MEDSKFENPTYIIRKGEEVRILNIATQLLPRHP